jgi:hypothetical protein
VCACAVWKRIPQCGSAAFDGRCVQLSAGALGASPSSLWRCLLRARLQGSARHSQRRCHIFSCLLRTTAEGAILSCINVEINENMYSQGQKLFNVRLGRTEQSSQLLIPYADEFKEQKQIDCGNIAAVTGLKVSIVLLSAKIFCKMQFNP